MTLTPKTTHVSEGQGQLITQFKGKTTFEAFVGTYLEQIQDIEDVVWQLLSIPGSIDDQEGAQLDLWGKIVGEDRGGKTDAVYRQYLQARLLINKASGLPDELKKVVSLVTSNDHVYQESYPAAFLISLVDAYSGDPEALATLLGEIRAAGVNGQLIYSTVDDAAAFTFADADAEQTSTEQGWASGGTIANGDFSAWAADNPDDWTVFENLANTFVAEVGSGESYGGAGSGACNLYDASGALVAYVEQSVELMPGIAYTITIVISAISGTIGVADPSYSQFGTETYTTTGTKTINFTASGGTCTIRLYTSGNPVDVTVDSVTCEPTTPFGGDFADAEEL